MIWTAERTVKHKQTSGSRAERGSVCSSWNNHGNLQEKTPLQQSYHHTHEPSVCFSLKQCKMCSSLIFRDSLNRFTILYSYITTTMLKEQSSLYFFIEYYSFNWSTNLRPCLAQSCERQSTLAWKPLLGAPFIPNPDTLTCHQWTHWLGNLPERYFLRLFASFQLFSLVYLSLLKTTKLVGENTWCCFYLTKRLKMKTLKSGRSD